MEFAYQFAQSSYYTYNATAQENAATAGVLAALMIFCLVIVIAAYVITSFLLSRIFKKAGIETWRAWVPVYNNWLTLELGNQKGYWAVLAFIPLINIVAAIFMTIAMYHIGLGFKKDGAFVLLAIFIPLAWYIWLAYDDSKWTGSHPESLPQKPETK